MTKTSPVPNPEHPETQIFTDSDISVNGKSYNSLDELPPELQQTVEAALSKLQGNPNLANILGSLGGIAKSARENGIGMAQIKNIDQTQIKELLKQHLSGKENALSEKAGNLDATISNTSSNTASFDSDQFTSPTNRNIPVSSSTYNPMVKGDGLRKAIFIGAILLVVGYLIVKFGFNGQLPF
jgi:hypothetical protein